MTDQEIIDAIKKLHPDIVVDEMAIRVCKAIAKPLEDRIICLEREINWIECTSRMPKIDNGKN